MRARLPRSSAALLLLLRRRRHQRAWCAAVGGAGISCHLTAASSPTTSLQAQCTAMRTYHISSSGGGGGLCTPTPRYSTPATTPVDAITAKRRNKKNNIKKEAPTTAPKTRAPRQRRPNSTQVATAEKSTVDTTTSAASPSLTRPSRPASTPTDGKATAATSAAAAEGKRRERRVLQLCRVTQEWTVLRERCRWQHQYDVAVGSSSSSGSGLTGTTASVVPMASLSASSSPSSFTRGGTVASVTTTRNNITTTVATAAAQRRVLGCRREVHAAERALLLSTLAKEASIYPQLYTVFYSSGLHHRHVSNNNNSSSSSSGEVVVDWEVQDVDAVVESETLTAELLTLLRVHADVTQQSADGTCLQRRAWGALIDALRRHIRSDDDATNTTTTTTVAQVLHVLVDARRDQLACGASTQLLPTTQKVKRKKHTTQQKQQRRRPLPTDDATTAVHARVSRVLTELVVPLHEVATQVCDVAVHHARQRGATPPPSSPLLTTGSAYGAASTLLMMAAVSALAEEAAGMLARSPAVPSSPVEAEQQHTAAAAVVASADGSVRKLRAWREAAFARLFAYLQDVKATAGEAGGGGASPLPPSSTTAAAGAAAAVFVDMLRCLRWTEELEVVLRAATLAKVGELCQTTLLRVCRDVTNTASTTTNDLFELLCTPLVSAELSRLSPDNVTSAQVITDLCTVAAAYVSQHSDVQINQLVDRVEAEHHKAITMTTTTTRTLSPPQRPPLRSPVVRIIYAMFCAGFAPSSILTCELCLSLSPRDTLDVVRAADTFSATCATAALPVRTRVVVVDQVVRQLLQCRRDGHRVVRSFTDSGGGGGGGGDDGRTEDGVAGGVAFSLATRLAEAESGADADADARPPARGSRAREGPASAKRTKAKHRRQASSPTHAGRTGPSIAAITTAAASVSEGGSSAGGGTDGGGVGVVLTPAVYRTKVNAALSVSISAVVECVLRGDAAAVADLGHALLPLLQQEGREAALTEALECIWATLRQRLIDLGSNERTIVTAATAMGTTRVVPPPMTAAMEEALAQLSALFLPPMTELAVTTLTRSGAITAVAAASVPGTQHSTTATGGGGGGAASPLEPPPRTEELLESALRLTTVAVLCGMPAGTVAQLTTLHNTLLKAHGRCTSSSVAEGEGTTGSSATADADVAAAFAVVERMERLLTDLTRQALPWSRHAHSAYMRSSALAVQQVLAVYLTSTANTVRGITQTAQSPPSSAAEAASSSAPRALVVVTAQFRHYLLTVVHLLYRLSTEFSVDMEPAALRNFRVEVLDPALTAVLAVPTDAITPPTKSLPLPPQQQPSKKKGSSEKKSGRGSASAPPLQMPLTSLTEVVVVMCVPESVQHVSPALMHGVAAAVGEHLAARRHGTATTAVKRPPVADTVTGVLATQLLSSAATVCLRADDTLTSVLLQLIDQLGPLLSLRQTITVLERLHATGAPLPAPPVRALLGRVVQALQRSCPHSTTTTASARVAQQQHVEQERLCSSGQQICVLHLLSALQRTTDLALSEQRWLSLADADVAALLRLLEAVPYVPLLKVFVEPSQLQRRVFTVGECGLVVEVVAQLLRTIDEEKAEVVVEGEEVISAMRRAPSQGEVASLRRMPRTLAAYVLQAAQLPPSLHDVPQLLRGYAALSSEPQLQQQMLRGFISRTIRAAPSMTPVEVVTCVEAYCAGGVFHEQLYGVLLGRAADMGHRLTLELSVRLLRCGTGSGHPRVRTVCVTAVRPIFASQVRGLLQSDPHMLVSVASTAVAILHCLRDCFPHDDISAAVLTNAARYRHDAALPVVTAALALIARRGSVDYDVAHIFSRHCVEAVLPSCSAAELTQVTCLLLSCGLRSAVLLSGVYQRLEEVIDTMPGSSLAKLVQGLLSASVDVDSTVTQRVCERVVTLTLDDQATPTALPATGRSAHSRVKTAAAAVAAPSVMPLTVPQVCVFLRLLRSIGRHNLAVAMETTDALLTYVQTRVEADVQTGRSADVADGGTSAPPAPVLADVHPREVEEMLRSCIEASSKPKMFCHLVRRLADAVAHLLRETVLADEPAAAVLDGGGGNIAQRHRRGRGSLTSGSSSSGGKEDPHTSTLLAWQDDLILQVDLCSLFVRLGEARHPVVHLLFTALYKRRGALLQRALLTKTTKQSLELAGRAAHPELFRLLVDGEVL